QQHFMHVDDPRAKALFHEGKFQMLRKSPEEMLAVRRLVFDNEHQPKDLIGKAPSRWGADSEPSAWKPDNRNEPKRFDHAAGSGSEVAWLRYRHLVPDHERLRARPELITDFMGYNTWQEQRGNHSSPAQDWVGDLMLECGVVVEQAQGDLILELSKGIDRFQARWDLSSGVCALVRLS